LEVVRAPGVLRLTTVYCGSTLIQSNDDLSLCANHVSKMTPRWPIFTKVLAALTPVKHKRTRFLQFIGRGIGLVERCAFVYSG
jgi:hypothetical protein